MKPLKTFLFIMKHGRMRLRLVKRVRSRDYMNKYGQAWNLPRFQPCPAPDRPNYISDEFPNLPRTPERPETPSRKRIRPTGPPPEPKRKAFDPPFREFATFAEAMEQISDSIEYKMAMQKLPEIAKEYFTGARKKNRKTLTLILKGEWFDMIASGEKLEEYREMKDYWRNRLVDQDGKFKEFDTVTFYHGYAKDRRKMEVEIIQIRPGYGNPSWGADPKEAYYIIQLGEILEKNF